MWASEQRLTLGQIATSEKSNEITAIPQVLEIVAVRGAIVTNHAMGCQRAIAKQIVDQGGDYRQLLHRRRNAVDKFRDRMTGLPR